MTRILIVEDEPGVQMTLEDRLQAEGYETSVKGDGISGQEEAETGEYDLMILDIMLPGRDGFAVCQNLRSKKINTPILMLTARNTNLDSIMGLRQGADDYMAKPFDMGLLLARIEALLRRSNLPTAKNSTKPYFEFGDFTLDLNTGTLTRKDDKIDLLAKEFALLQYLVKHPGELLKRDTILDEVWGYESETTTRTVDVHIAKLRQKLGESELPRHIQTLRGRGYKFIP
ncbi:response regulator transcription factor [Oceanispirochaeta crateris]|uniref:Response regulator transcription factor n=1 Tax=Oceanispirochaeta crateris TaxID=2518645 RepID=A0A5C1QNT5_9SPIO|nr:response regulator transcription factor [Oceanispirochaeta crateris]QEN08214.1 response regulator transcription factor [Oceanispirochaeta crateris]